MQSTIKSGKVQHCIITITAIYNLLRSVGQGSNRVICAIMLLEREG